jgi:hypothetical protein
MDKNSLKALQEKKFSRWGHRRPLFCSDQEQYQRASEFRFRSDLSLSEKSAFYLHELTGCDGYEFVAFSNAKLKNPVFLTSGVILYPCFYSDLDGKSSQDHLVQASIRMQNQCRFVYDGWIPIDIWDDITVRNALQTIEKALSSFSMSGSTIFDWESKYPISGSPQSIYHFRTEDIRELEKLVETIDSLRENDKFAIYRSLGWLSQGIRLSEPAARYLFSILAVESLVTYIEENVKEDSPLVVLKTNKFTDNERNLCIDKTLKLWLDENPRKAIKLAYSECVVTISRRLKKHLGNVFGEESQEYRLLFKDKVEGRTLYDLRHNIAHGEANALSEKQRDKINQRIFDAERISKKYLWLVFKHAFDLELFTKTMQASVSINPQNMVASNENMYKGPTHMAFLYTM